MTNFDSRLGEMAKLVVEQCKGTMLVELDIYLDKQEKFVQFKEIISQDHFNVRWLCSENYFEEEFDEGKEHVNYL